MIEINNDIYLKNLILIELDFFFELQFIFLNKIKSISFI